MVNRFLSTFGALSIFALLVGFGGATPAAKVKFPAKSIAEIPITHHFSQFVPGVGALAGGSPPSIALAMPAEAGLAISTVTWMGGTGAAAAPGMFIASVNGAEIWRGSLLGITKTFDPALIIPPGTMFQLGHVGQAGNYADFEVTGYTLEPGYFGS